MNPIDGTQDGSSNQQQPDNNAPSIATPVQSEPPKPEVGDIPPSVVKDKTEQATISEQQSEHDAGANETALADRIRTSDRLMIGLTAIIAFATCVQAYFVWDGGRQTERMVTASEGIKTALNQSAKQTKANFAVSLKESDKALRSTLAHNRGALNATLSQSKSALDASVENARNDQRAWVGAVEVIGPRSVDEHNKPTYIKSGTVPEFGVVMTNTGKSIAKNFEHKVAWRILPKSVPLTPEYGNAVDIMSKTTMFPAMKTITWTIHQGPISKDDITALSAGDKIFYVFGTLSYSDAFDRPHSTTFCMVLDRKLDGFRSCNTYNYAD